MNSGDVNISKVSDAIDSLLNRPCWTKKEVTFYRMLVSKVKEYSNKLPKPKESPLRDLSNDIKDIQGNIALQPWFKHSNNQGTITELFRHMKIAKCRHQGSPEAHNYRYRLELKLGNGTGRETPHLVMEVARDMHANTTLPYHFRVYYGTGANKGHIAAYTPGKSKGHTLPEYDYLVRIFPSLERHEIICLAIELVLYYDVDSIMAKLPIGNNYPITLQQLMKGIVNGLEF